MRDGTRLGGAWVAGVAALFVGALPLSAQVGGHDALLTGYGTTAYTGSLGDTFVNGFSASMSPILLYTMGSDFLFEAEVEFELEEGATAANLEYAQVDYQGLENLQLVAGKFLLPFGVFGERLHPSWVNKLPTMPLLFGHGEGGVPHDALLPVLSDVGAMARWSQPVGSGWALDVSGWVSQGPSIAEPEEEEGHAAGEEEEVESPAPPIAWGVAFTDNNRNKMIGGRAGLVKGPSFETYVSGFHARYDPDQHLDVWAAALSAEWRSGPFQIRSEGVLLSQDFMDEAGTSQTLDRSGLYVEASRRFGPWEPVARWGRLFDGKVDDETVQEARNSLAVGIDYWFEPMIPLKVAYVTSSGRDDRVVVQWAFGF